MDEFAVDKRKMSGHGAYCQECDRERSREYYAANRERVLEKAAEKREPRPVRHCSECGVELEGRASVCCGASKCRDARLKRENPEAYAKRQARKVERRRQARRRASEGPAPSPAT